MATTTDPAPSIEKPHISSDYVIVDTFDLLSSSLDTLYSLPAVSPTSAPALYVDLEGFDLCRDGRIALVTIYAAPIKTTYVFDVTILGAAVFTTGHDGRTLQGLLQDETIPKVLFDCRNDSDALYNLYQVDMAGVRDVQLMELATRRGSRRLLNGLAKVIRDYAGLSPEDLEQWSQTKTSGKAIFVSDPEGTVWEQRPLDPTLLRYSIQDVTLLPKLYSVFDAKLSKKWREKVDNEVFWRLQLSRQVVYYGKNTETAALGPW